ncbi:MAG TPA: right-handed parallel beta-helix repeat-containing protein [Gemmatimonadaceae bacterium]|nr:right-handed parallel beta-helix repeat-containing protein [Gemmatimonadaceae bacterium]
MATLRRSGRLRCRGLARTPGLTIVAALTLALPRVAHAQQDARAIELRSGLVITESVRIVPKLYRLHAASSLDSAVITIRGSDITVDFTGATMEGTDPQSPPDLAKGVAIRVEGGRNVRIRGARVRGYKVGILARGTRRLTLEGNDLSYNWKPRLYSLVEHESLVDWLSFHHNENDEWLRYGAAIYLADVTGGEIRDNRAVQGMNGLLVVRSDSLRIAGNDFSYDSGLGMGMYRSSYNEIVHNRLDYDVRGYSEGFYRRGQDSAGLLMYEQSSHNIVAYNSATHGGDGLFLWAGQSTMDSGQGGANDNVFFANDFSFAPANCMEATFSRNTFVGNRLEGCEYGLWGGYSFDSKVVGNRFIRNRFGIGIEHGQNNVILSNSFDGDSTALSVWAKPVEPSEWMYPKVRDTRSRDYRVENNRFSGNRVAVRAVNTAGLSLEGNQLVGVDSPTVLQDTSRFRAEGNSISGRAASVAARDDHFPSIPAAYARLAPAPRGITPATRPLATRPRSSIVVDEWGPYDWRSPKLWPVDSTRAEPLRLAVLGPPGSWRVVEERGIAALSERAGRTMDTIAVTPASGAAGSDWELVLEYRGEATVSRRGVRRPAGEPVRFSYGRFEPAIHWTARLFAWGDSAAPAPDDVAELLRSAPLRTFHVPRLDIEGYGELLRGTTPERFVLDASGTMQLLEGTYTLRTISDDAVRVWVDGALVIDHWKPHESKLDFTTLHGGRHELRVQYVQLGGWGELRVEVVRGLDRSPGTPAASS